VHFGKGSQGNTYDAHGNAGRTREEGGKYFLRLCVDNSSVVHVTNAFVAPSKPMKRELRPLCSAARTNVVVIVMSTITVV
jgi:hypothetical protein